MSDGVEEVAVAVEHVEAEVAGVGGEDGEACGVAAVDGALCRGWFAAAGARGVDDIIGLRAGTPDVLEVVDVAADIHVYLVAAQYSVDPFLHVGALGLRFVRVGVDGMVAHHDSPVLGGVGECPVEPLQLCLGILRGRVGIGVGLLAVFVDEGSGVDEDYLQ